MGNRKKLSLDNFIRQSSIDCAASLKTVIGGILADCHCVVTHVYKSEETGKVWVVTECN